MTKAVTYTLRRCRGNPRYWTYDAGGLIGTTDSDLGRLVATLARRAAVNGEPCPVFVVSTSAEAEAAANRERLEAEAARIKSETTRAKCDGRYRRQRLAEIAKELAT